MGLAKQIQEASASMHEELIAIRRHLHAHPELSFQEKNTNRYICNYLDKHNIPYKSGYCKYGILAEIKGSGKGKTVYLRGDMDALPILETNKHEYVSRNKGVMHACGHDVHTTCVLGAAIVLSALRKNLQGTVKVIFQPGEEKLPGGASIMIEEGVIKEKKNAIIYGQHVHPPLEVGKVGFHPGEYMASADELYIEIKGKGGHAALPQDCIDTILVASEVVSKLHQCVSRYSNPQVPTVLSVGKIWSEGGATNIIPDVVHMQGTLRSMDESNRKKMHEVIRRMVKQTTAAYGAKARTRIVYGYPTLKNNPELVFRSMDYARAYLGEENVVMLPKRMTAEDFAFFSQMMPACFFRLGTGNSEKGITSPVHTSDFDIDERALQVGTGLMAYMATEELKFP